MAEGARAGGREPVPGAPPDATTLAEARRRWRAYRAEVWLALAEVRGQASRAAVLRRLRPGSVAFRLVTGVAQPLFALRRRLRGAVRAPALAVPFPFGEEPPAPVGRAPSGEPVTTGLVEGDDPLAAVAAANRLAGGEGWVMVLDAGDRLLDGALEAMAASGADHGADLVFGDERTRDERGRLVHRARPRTPGWVSLLSHDATGRAVLFRASALRSIGGFDPAAGWAFRHDAVVRLVEAGAVALHATATVVESPAEDPRYAQGLAATSAAALARRAGGGDARAGGEVPGLVRWRPAPPARWPSVSVVIPTRDRLDLLAPCLEALEARTTYPAYDVVIVDNDSRDPATLAFLEGSAHTVVRAPGPFNYARVVNRGVAAARGEYVVTLNNDVTVRTPDWLEQMVGVLGLPGVGVVGVYLEEPDGRAQHEGVAIAPYPQHLRRDRNYLVPDAYLEATREASAVTGACQMLSRALLDELGGLDETMAVVHNDIDLCLRARRRGHAVVYLATVRHQHAESSSRGRLTPVADIERFIARWDVFGALEDPCFPERWELVGDVVRWRRPR